MCYSVVSVLSQGNSVPNSPSPRCYNAEAATSPSSHDGSNNCCCSSLTDGPYDWLYPKDDFLDQVWDLDGLFPPGPGYPTDDNQSRSGFLCKVCGDKASGNHFGVLSCEACKSFFRRSIRAGARYACRGNRNCAVDRQSRNRCQYCRLMLCFKIGMKKEAVQDERAPAKAKKRSRDERFQSDNGYGSSLSDIESFSDKKASAGTPTGVAQDVGFLISELLSNEASGDDRTHGVLHNTVGFDTLLRSMSAFVVKLIEWARRIPAFAGLPMDDQVQLLRATWYELYVLHLATHNGADLNAVVLGQGLVCKREQIGDPEIRRVVDRIFSEVSGWFETISAEPVELSCLKGILLFNPSCPQLSANAKKDIEVYQEQILAFLETHSKTTHSTVQQRFSKLLLRLGAIQSISKEVMQFLEVQLTLGHTQMDSLLTELVNFH